MTGSSELFPFDSVASWELSESPSFGGEIGMVSSGTGEVGSLSLLVEVFGASSVAMFHRRAEPAQRL